MSAKLKATFVLTDGSTITCMPGDYRAVIDRRGSWEQPQRVWEILVAGHVMKRLWPEHVISWDFQAPL